MVGSDSGFQREQVGGGVACEQTVDRTVFGRASAFRLSPCACALFRVITGQALFVPPITPSVGGYPHTERHPFYIAAFADLAALFCALNGS